MTRRPAKRPRQLLVVTGTEWPDARTAARTVEQLRPRWGEHVLLHQGIRPARDVAAAWGRGGGRTEQIPGSPIPLIEHRQVEAVVVFVDVSSRLPRMAVAAAETPGPDGVCWPPVIPVPAPGVGYDRLDVLPATPEQRRSARDQSRIRAGGAR